MDKEDKKTLFPSIVKSLDDFLYEEEGNITRNKIVAMGTMVLILSLLMMDDAFAGHRSHSSHRSIVLIVLALEVVIAVMNRMYHIQVIHLLQQAIIAIVQAM